MAQVKTGRCSIIKIVRRISGLIVCALVVMLLSVDSDARQLRSHSAGFRTHHDCAIPR